MVLINERTFVLINILALLLQDALSQSDCNYFQNLEPEKTYYIYNREYPNNYKGKNICVWRSAASSVLQLNCTLEMSSSQNCNGDHLSVQFSGSKEDIYCGYGSFRSEGYNVTIRLKSTKCSKGGRFLCELRTKIANKCQCGWRITPRIAGGSETGVNEFPMMAALIDIDKKDIYCGATIISPQHVITAAHCVYMRKIPKIGVLIGAHNILSVTDAGAQLYSISNVIVHPLYTAETLDNDIAICQIIGTIQYNLKLGPVCLPFGYRNDSFVGTTVIALGWGSSEFSGPKSTVLQKVNLNVVANCHRSLKKKTESSTICIYSPGKDTCQYDNGGPLLWQNPTTSRLVLVGITSDGVGCASDEPSIGIRTGYYMDWILSMTPAMTINDRIRKGPKRSELHHILHFSKALRFI